jgi:hypothetical protein
VAKNEDDAPVSLSRDEARAGVTGHHVRYVLAFGLAGSLIAFLGIVLYFGYGTLTQTIAEIFATRNTRTATCPLRSSLGACGGRDRASAWFVEHGLGAQREH